MTTTIYVIRHAEKAANSGDTPLSNEGHARAAKLVHVLADETISSVFATQALRTQQTAAPIATAVGVTVQAYDSEQALADEIKNNHSGECVLVVGHLSLIHI